MLLRWSVRILFSSSVGMVDVILVKEDRVRMMEGVKRGLWDRDLI